MKNSGKRYLQIINIQKNIKMNMIIKIYESQKRFGEFSPLVL